MTLPRYKVEIYNNGSLTHSVTDGAHSIYYKDMVTQGVGHFAVKVPTVKGVNTYPFSTVNLHDMVKIWLDYDSVSGDPDFVGYINRKPGTLTIEEGFVTTLSGYGLGEVLLSRLKRQKQWADTGASTIVSELAADLGLGTGEIETDSTNVADLAVQSKKYIDILRHVSDYWYNAATQVKKDFKVDVDNNLVWKNRPWRTADVETFTLGTNIKSYTVVPDKEVVRNKIHVYGEAELTIPSDGDSWTENSTEEWSTGSPPVIQGTSSVAGDYSIRGSIGAGLSVYLAREWTSAVEIGKLHDQFKRLKFYCRVRHGADALCNDLTVTVGSDGANLYRYHLMPPELGEWTEREVTLGPDTVPELTYGSPSWTNITYLQVLAEFASSDWAILNLDAVRFHGARYYVLKEDSSSQSSYGVRELEHISDQLHSTAECVERGEVLLYQLKDPPTQLTLTTRGNSNILPGDRVPVTIAPEGLNEDDFDLLEVEQIFTPGGGWTTGVTGVNSVNVRRTVHGNLLWHIAKMQGQLHRLNVEERTIR